MYSRFLLSKLLFVFITSRVRNVSAEIGEYCQQAVFETVGEGSSFSENVISSHHVESWLECGQLCLQENCNSFRHLSDKNYVEINCQLRSKTKHSLGTFDQNTNDRWTIYKIKEVESEICRKNKLCQNGGQCIMDSCAIEGYTCKCDRKYYGKRCENENSDYDLTFLSQPTLDSHIKMDEIKTDLTQLTFTTWFKIAAGLQVYHLLSYMANEVPDQITLFFSTYNDGAINIFCGGVNRKDEKAYMIPVNDGYWHHLGFTWSNRGGEWNVYIDGTHRCLKKLIKVGAIIPKGGTLVIGQKLTTLGFKPNKSFAGEISRLNLWDRALSGDEVEAMAKFPGNERGNLISWFKVVDNFVGDIKVIVPSKAQNTDQGLDFQLSFQTPTTEKDYILSPSPTTQHFEKLSVCLWVNTLAPGIFISYNTEDELGQSFTFGIDSNNFMLANINGSLIKSTTSNTNIINNQWHFLCVTWDGVSGQLIFYYDSSYQGDKIKGDHLAALLQGGGNFLVGVSKDTTSGLNIPLNGFTGTMSYLNVWQLIIPKEAIAAMTSGGVNINGDLLSWRNVPRRIVGNVNVQNKTVIRYPGYGLLAKRSKWCNDHVTSKTCSILYARLGENREREMMKWRCYCSTALYESKYTYNVGSNSNSYITKHGNLIAIVD